MKKHQEVYNYLKQLNISFETHNHQAVFTIDEAADAWATIEGMHCKNLFFRNKKGNQHYLVVLEGEKQLDIKNLEKVLGVGRLSFGSKERLEKQLQLLPGSVSPFGLINNTENNVQVLIDADVQKSKKVNFHPNDNTATITLSAADFYTFLEAVGNPFKYIVI